MAFLSEKQARFTQLAILTFCLFTGTACSKINKENTQMTYSNPYNLEFFNEEYSTIGNTGIPIHFNPNPKKIYEITIDIQNSPMPLIPLTPTAVNYYSLTEYNTNPIYSSNPSTYLKVPVSKIDDNTYQFILIEDAILDEDYGLTHYWKKIGISHWEMGINVFNILFTPTGQIQETYFDVSPFSPSNGMEQYVGHHTFFYKKKDVTSAPPLIDGYGNPFGRQAFMLTSDELKDELKNINSDELFSITVTVKKLF